MNVLENFKIVSERSIVNDVRIKIQGPDKRFGIVTSVCKDRHDPVVIADCQENLIPG